MGVLSTHFVPLISILASKIMEEWNNQLYKLWFLQATEALCHLSLTDIKKIFCKVWFFFCKNEACANCTGWNSTTVIWLPRVTRDYIWIYYYLYNIRKYWLRTPLIRMKPLGKKSKINKRRTTFIPETTVNKTEKPFRLIQSHYS